jgi:hypothetical protein
MRSFAYAALVAAAAAAELPNGQLVSNGMDPAQAHLPLPHCHGDCDEDHHCQAGYKCHQNNGFESIPQCEGTVSEAMDYCIRIDNTAPDTAASTTLAENECDKTSCSLVTNSAGYDVIQVTHPANNDFETVCHDGQDYSKGAQDVAHTAAVTKHCAMVGTDCKCFKAGFHPNGAVPADVDSTPAGWSGSSGTGTATTMDHSGRAGIETALAAHEAIDDITATDTAAAAAIAVAETTRDGTTYAAHDGHVN